MAPQDWSLAELIALADDRAAVTSRLDEVMKTSCARDAVATIALAVDRGGRGGVPARGSSWRAGRRGQRRSSLARPSGPPSLSSMWAQLYQAKTVDTKAAWEAVQLHFPEADPYYHNLAKQGLAQYYLRAADYDDARGPLRDLAQLGSSNPSLAAFGIAGLVVAEANLGNIEAARNENSRLTSDMRANLQQRSPQLAELLDEALRDLESPQR